MVWGGHAPYSPGLSKQYVYMGSGLGIANISKHCRSGGGVLFNMDNATFWPILANFATFVAIFCTFSCAFGDLNNAVVYQN